MINFQPFPNLLTERLLLRQLSTTDDKELFSLRSDDRVLEFTGIKKATGIEDVRQFITKINAGTERNESILWGMALKDNNQLIGTICLWNIDWEQAVGEIGYMLHPDQQRKGLMQEAIISVLDYGFNRMLLQRIDAEVVSANTASIKSLERNHFVISKKSEHGIIYSLQKEQQ